MMDKHCRYTTSVTLSSDDGAYARRYDESGLGDMLAVPLGSALVALSGSYRASVHDAINLLEWVIESQDGGDETFWQSIKPIHDAITAYKTKRSK